MSELRLGHEMATRLYACPTLAIDQRKLEGEHVNMQQVIRHWRSGSVLLIAVFVVVGGIAWGMGTAKSTTWLQAAGGALLASGLTVLAATVTSREATRLQQQKEATSRRRADVYRPLHEELYQLRELLGSSLSGKQPYPRWIQTGGTAPSEGRLPVEHQPKLVLWPKYAESFQTDDFTQAFRGLMVKAMTAAEAYNVTIVPAAQACERNLTKAIDQAFATARLSPDFTGQQSQPGAPQTLSELVAITPPQEAACQWLYGFPYYQEIATLGGLIGGVPRLAAEYILLQRSRNGYYRSIPEEMLQSIFDTACQASKQDPACEKTRQACQALAACVSHAVSDLQTGLKRIRDTFEGGEPMV